MEKPFESPHANGGFRFMDWLDYVEERYGYKEVGEVKSPEEYDPDRAIHLQLNADLFPLSKIIIDDDAE